MPVRCSAGIPMPVSETVSGARPTGARADNQANLPASLRETRRVVQHVAENLHEARLVAVDDDDVFCQVHFITKSWRRASISGTRWPGGDRPCPVGTGAGRRCPARGRDEPGAAQAGQRPPQPRRADGAAGRRDLRSRLHGRSRTAGGVGVRGVRRPSVAGSTSSWPRVRAARPRSTCGPSDYVNMGLARHGDVPTVVVGDIDRGGWFASAYGTLMLLDEADRALIKGYVVNKFRGDVDLLRPGLADLERADRAADVRRTAVAPRSLARLRGRARPRGSSVADGARQVAVVRLPRISNFTDVDALGLEPGLDVVFVSDPARLADADLVVLPGTRSTLADLAWLRSRGLDRAIVAHAARRPAGARDLRWLPDAGPLDRRPRRGRGTGRRRGRGARAARPDDDVRRPRRCCGCTSRPATRSTTAG